MKTFKQHIKEEWLYSDKETGEVFKNPTSREWKEYISGVTQYGVAGFYKKGNVYVFEGESKSGYSRTYHDTVMRRLKIKNTKDVVLFRATVKGPRIISLHIGGNDINTLLNGTKDDAHQARMYVEMYNHKSLKPHIKSPLPTALGEIISFMGKQQFTEATGISV